MLCLHPCECLPLTGEDDVDPDRIVVNRWRIAPKVAAQAIQTRSRCSPSSRGAGLRGIKTIDNRLVAPPPLLLLLSFLGSDPRSDRLLPFLSRPAVSRPTDEEMYGTQKFTKGQPILGPAWRGERIWLASFLIVLSRGIPSSLPRPGSRRQVLARAQRPFISVVSPPVAGRAFRPPPRNRSTSALHYLPIAICIPYLTSIIRIEVDSAETCQRCETSLEESWRNNPLAVQSWEPIPTGASYVNLHPTEDPGCDAFRQPRSVSVRSRDLACSTSLASSFEKLMMSSFEYAVQIDNNPVIKRFIIHYLYRP